MHVKEWEGNMEQGRRGPAGVRRRSEGCGIEPKGSARRTWRGR